MTTKMTEEELAAVSSLQDDYAAIALARGQLEFAKADIELQIQSIIQEFDEVRQKEANLVDVFRQKYGEGKVNMETGEFTPTEAK